MSIGCQEAYWYKFRAVVGPGGRTLFNVSVLSHRTNFGL